MKISFKSTALNLTFFCMFFSTIELTAKPHTFSSHKAIIDEKGALQEIESTIGSKHYYKLGKLLEKNIDVTVTLNEVKQIAIKHNATHLLSAIEATQAIGKQKIKNLGSSRSKFLQTALFIEYALPEYVKRKHFFLKKEQTGLSCALEYDPQTKKTFIILDKNEKTYLGRGANKVVTKSILYNKSKPEIIARALQTQVREIELEITSKFKDAEGIMKVLSCTKYIDKGVTYRTIYAKLYNTGSLSHAFKMKCKFSLYEKMKIAHNILQGLRELHEKNIAHFDIASANCLIEIPREPPGRRNIVAVIADLGRANTINTPFDPNKRVQGHTSYTPPEGLFTEKMRGRDYCSSDVYAVGCIFYQLFYNKLAPWQDSKLIRSKTESKSMVHDKLVGKIQQYTGARRTYLTYRLAHASENDPLITREAFEHLILRMVDPNPKARGTAAELYQELKMIMQQSNLN